MVSKSMEGGKEGGRKGEKGLEGERKGGR